MQTMADRDGLIWLDGEMIPWREAKTHVLTHTLHYGMGVFEGVRAYHAEQGTAIFRHFIGGPPHRRRDNVASFLDGPKYTTSTNTIAKET